MTVPAPPPGPPTASLGDVLDRITARWGVVVACSILLAVAATVVGSGRPVLYDATAVVTVAPLSTQPFEETQQVNIATEREVVRSTAVAAQVAGRLPGSPSLATLLDQVLVTAPNNSQVMSITVTAGSPVAAAERANAFAEAYLAIRAADADEVAERFIATLEDRADALRRTIEAADDPSDASVVAAQQQLSAITQQQDSLETVALNPGRVISTAEPPTSPSSPGTIVYLAAGILLGGLIGIAAALVLDRADRTVHDPKRLASLLTGEMLVDAHDPNDPLEPYRRAFLLLQRDPAYMTARTALPPALPAGSSVSPLLVQAAVSATTGGQPTVRSVPVVLLLSPDRSRGAEAAGRIASAAGESGLDAVVIAAQDVAASDIDRGWPSAAERRTWLRQHDLVIIDASGVSSTARRLVLAERTDLNVLAVPSDARTVDVEDLLDGLHDIGRPPNLVLAVAGQAASSRAARRAPSTDEDSRVLLIASNGGHLAQLLALEGFWRHRQRRWVSFDRPDAVAALRGEQVTWAYHPTTRHPWNAVRNTWLAVTDLLGARPDVIVTTGAGVAVPFFLVARLFRIRTVFIEVIDRIDSPTLSGRLCYRLSDAFCIQWEEQRRSYPEATLIGPVL